MNDIIAKLSLEEKSYAVKILSELDKSGTSDTLSNLWDIDFIREPVTPEVFLTNPYYLGQDISSKIYPVWKELLIDILDPNSQVIELVLSGSIGCGKSSTSVIAMMYKLYYLSCLKNPQAYYGLMEHSMISFVMFSATLKLVSNTSYNDFLNMFKKSPYFNNHYDSSKKRYIELPDKNVRVMIGSNEIHEQGLNCFAACLDESNYVGPKSDRDHVKAFTIYSQIRTRMESRFMYAGSQPGLVCLVSSARTESDYIDKHIEKSRNNPHVAIRSYPIWEVKNRPGMYCGETFRVDLGTKFRSPSILMDGSDDPIEGKTVHVPIEYVDSFKRDLYQGIRDIIGVSGQPLSPFLSDKNLVLACIDKNQINPFSVPTVLIDIDNDAKLSDYFNPSEIFTYKYGKFSPIRNPGTARVAHIDLADVNDPCGLTIGHLDNDIVVERLLPNGEKFHIESNSVRIDLMIQLRPRMGHRLDYSKIREFFMYLINMNMTFDKITLDSYQSSDMIQYFTKLGIKSNVLSVDRTDVPYTSLKNAIIENRIHYYEYPIFIREVSNLEHDMANGKVDHRVGETKDVTDSVAAVVHSLSASDKSLGDPIMSMVGNELLTPQQSKTDNDNLVSDYSTSMEITDILGL